MAMRGESCLAMPRRPPTKKNVQPRRTLYSLSASKFVCIQCHAIHNEGGNSEVTNFRFVSILSVAVVLAAAWESPAQPNERSPLVWAADADGGKPYVFQDPANPKEI